MVSSVTPTEMMGFSARILKADRAALLCNSHNVPGAGFIFFTNENESAGFHEEKLF